MDTPAPLDKIYTIGFSNLCDKHVFAATVREGLEQAVAAHPNLRLICRDNDFDTDRAMQNARELAAAKVDLGIIYHLDERANPLVANILLRAGIPVITVDIPIAPWITFFGVNNEEAGRLIGAELGRWIKQHWGGQVDKIVILTDNRVLDEIRKRTDYALITLADWVRFSSDDVLHLDSGNTHDIAYERSLPVLQRWGAYHRIAVIGMNDETAIGALDAARALGRESDVAVAGQGADSLALAELRSPNSRLIASVAYFPERYGERLVELALRFFRGEKLERRYTISHVCITRSNLADFYPSAR
jgi:ribose transport system substrate-binding protein